MTREQAVLLLRYIRIAAEKAARAAKHGGYVEWDDLEDLSEELLDSCEEDTP